jgi:protease IV
MRLRWIGAIVLAGVLLLSAACVGAIFALGVTQISAPTEDHVAVIPVHGPVVTREPAGFFASGVASAEVIVAQLEQAREDSSVKAIILDIDTPGGGVVATQQIHAEIARVREDGIPIVAYFGDTAASAGYYIGATADYIVTNPATITGSIGAIAMVPNFEELYDKLGIEMQTVTTGEFKDMFQPSRGMTKEEREILQTLLDESFADFKAAVAEGRNMSMSEVERLADGRIYTGRQAVENGLADELGDFRYAVSFTGELAGLGDDPVIRDYGPDPDFWDVLFGFSQGLFDFPVPFELELDPRNVHIELKYEVGR